MERLYQLVKSPLANSLLINIFFLLLCIVFGDLQYGTLDDYFMAGILTGIHGTDYNPHLFFVNALYGYALIPLYRLLPDVGWYYLGEMFSVFLCFTTICFIVMKRLGSRWGLLCSIVFLSFFATDYYLVVQFTQCGSLLSATGMLVFANEMISKKKMMSQEKNGARSVLLEYSPFIYAIFLLYWGSVMRWQAFLMGMPFFACCLLFCIKCCLQKKYQVILFLTILFAGTFLMHSVDQRLYDTERYSPYKEIQGPRSAIVDASDFDMNSSYEDLEELEISGLDFHMARSWTFYDTEIFSVEKMSQMVKVFDRYRNVISWKEYPDLILLLLQKASTYPMFWMWFILCILIYMTNPKKFGYTLLSLVVIVALSLTLISVNRLVYRVEGGFWLYASILAIPMINEIKFVVSRKIFIGLIVLLLTANVLAYYSDGNLVRDITKGEKSAIVVEDSTDYSKVFDYIDSRPGTMFLLDMPTYMHFAQHKNPPYKSEPMGSWKRTVSFGFWTPYLPEITESLKEFGITNPMKDVVNDNVVVIGQGNLKEYLERHYDEAVKVDTLKKIDDVVFFKYSTID